MQGECAQAMRFAPRVQREGKQHIGGFRLAVSFPLVVCTTLEMRVVEVDAAKAMPTRRYRHDAGATGFAQSR
jgi:hypothetical protein